MHVPSLSLAQRCMHVARAQAPALSPVVVDTLLSALMQCMLYPSATSFAFATEVLVALRELLDAADAQQVRSAVHRVLLHVWWAQCMLCIHTEHVPFCWTASKCASASLTCQQCSNLLTRVAALSAQDTVRS